MKTTNRIWRKYSCSSPVALKCERLLFVVVRLVGESLGNTYGSGTGRILLDNVNCDGSETFIGDCPHNGWKSHNCDHEEDVSIRCINSSGTTNYHCTARYNHMIISCTVKPVFFRVPFISQISRAWQVRENNGPRKFKYSSVLVL